MTLKTHPTSKKSGTPRKRSGDSLARIKQRIDNVKFIRMLYMRDDVGHDSADRICILNDELDHLMWLLEK